ncbi:DUF7005 family protein [Aquimarina brevivitae]|uniref:Uncharacterized protein n=1 Tax=Aquimarina brevivitae TaxID=323412 RepID=A0A4Q7PG24_9FLAO|nr:hypothetical protein [Aquimarina brevivitae]RZS99444.1 hypothetical protein EV197_0654 [Aquimarina brevivitae]
MCIKINTYDVLKTYTNDNNIIDELVRYTHNKFIQDDRNYGSNNCKELLSESNIGLDIKKTTSVFKHLKSNWVKFHFPIQKNISKHPEYKDATLKGIPVESLSIATGLQLNAPEQLKLSTYQSIGGKVSIVTVPDSEDFKTVIRALCHKNEPVKIPDSMGAAMIKGIINWKRIVELKREWETTNLTGSWGHYFKKHIVPKTDLYKDKVIVLSTKPYSNCKAEAFNLKEKEWITHSINIRLYHECFHLFTLKEYGTMANNMHDELIADYYGIRRSIGSFKKQWLLQFIGLEEYPNYRKGARLENYLGIPPLSDKAFEILQTLLKNAIDNLSAFDQTLGTDLSDKEMIRVLKTLCSTDLIALSSNRGPKLLQSTYEKLHHLTYNQV